MKKIIYFICLLSVLSCNDDDIISDRNFDPMNLYGEWLFYDGTNKFSAVHMIIDNNAKLKLDVYANYETSGEPWRTAVGSWFYSSRTKHMKTTALYEAQEVSIDKSYDIMNVDNCTLKMLDTDTHSFVTYHRVINTYNKFMSETFRIENYPDGFSPNEFVSLNPHVAKVDANGNITTVGIGTTFVIAKCDGFETAVKVVVRNGVKEHSAEVNQSIDDIIKKYGDDYYGPYHNANSESGNFLQAIYYEYPELEPYVEQLQYHYDPTSRAITCIDVYYPLESVSALINDTQYILDSNTYNEHIVNGTKRYVYKGYGDFWDSEVYIQCFSNCIRYGSTNFLKCLGYVNVFNNN